MNINITTSTTQTIIDNSFDFEDFDDTNKVLLDINHNCSSNDDCNVKHSLCDPTFNTCECDITSMQTSMKCRVLYCSSNEECLVKYADSMCTLGRCQCISGRKFNGKCIRAMGMMFMNPLPDWAIISIAVTLALSVIAGGSLQKRELRQHIMRIIRLFLMRDTQLTDQTMDSIDSNNRNTGNNDDNNNNKDIELSNIE